MKLSENFILKQVAGSYIVLPLGESTLDFNGMITLNESGVLLWNTLKQECDFNKLIDVLTSEYKVSREEARADINEFLNKLTDAGCIEGDIHE